jgi:primosomal protein N' (replication factor Y)
LSSVFAFRPPLAGMPLGLPESAGQGVADDSGARVSVVFDLPLYRHFDYRLPAELRVEGASSIGRLVQAPFGSRQRIGLVIGEGPVAADEGSVLRDLEAFVDGGLPPLPASWFSLCEFAAAYYQAPLGEVMLQALPKGLRRLDPPQPRQLRRAAKVTDSQAPPLLNVEQAAAVSAVVGALGGFQTFLLFGITGSGKTEVYLNAIAAALAAGRQILLMVPEINLTPQLEARVARRFPEVPLVALHSELTEATRLRNWRAAFLGEARIVLGTRLSVFTPLPDLGLLILDEEHDASYKQQDGTRYSARDLAVVRARQQGVPVVLGSATPSLESWANAEAGRYQRLLLGQRAVSEASLPAVRIVDTRREKLVDGLSAELRAAIALRLARGEQSLLFLNRRGYAPVLACPTCGWVAPCHRCAANLVVHRADRRLRCHHCGLETPIPRACPDCGNQDIHAFGRGTQRLEEALAVHFPTARILRADRDAARSRHQWEVLAARIHAGEADLLVGTQMLAKGHDFPGLTLVGVIGADAALFAADWRAPERLFAQLMQVAGRAGRAERAGEVLVQTEHPEHPLYRALVEHDFAAFAATLLAEREVAAFPPYSYQAVLRADAPRLADSLDFLAAAVAAVDARAHPAVTLYDPVPMKLARLANRERAQLLVESPSRPALQAFLAAWRPAIDGLKTRSGLRWHIEVDPHEL